jgi:oligoribonuclease
MNEDNIKYCILDIETTGLDPDSGMILEVGALLLDRNLNGVAEFESMVNDVSTATHLGALRERAWTGDKPSEFIIDMHTKSGLLADIAQSTYYRSVGDVEELLCDWLYRHGLRNSGREDGEEGTKVYLAGSSVHFDVEYLDKYMPDIVGHFYHRRLDASAFKVVGEELLSKRYRPEYPVRHRALPDCNSSLNELRFYLRNMCHVAFDVDRNDPATRERLAKDAQKA